MVSDATFVAAIGSIGGTVATILTIASLWVWRHTTALHDEDVEKIAALLDAEWERAGAALADFFVDVVAEIDHEVDSPPCELRAEFEQIAVQEMDESDVSHLVDTLRDVGQGRSLHRSHRAGYKNAYVYFATAAVATMVDVLLGIVYVVDALPDANTDLAVVLLGIAAVVATLRGILSFGRGQQRKEEFVDAWETVRLEE